MLTNDYINYNLYFGYKTKNLIESTWYIIINPTSGNGKALQKWVRIKKELVRLNIVFEEQISQYHKHVISLAKNATDNKYQKIVCVGGDGTLHQVVNGVLQSTSDHKSTIKIGIIPIGTGNDWAKQYGIPASFKKAIHILKKDNTVYQDIGKITTQSTTVYFNNSAGIGFDGFVANKVKQYKAFRSFSYFLAAFVGIFSFKRIPLTIHFNSTTIQKKTLLVVIGLCRYSGGGMQLTSLPSTTDGKFDISYISKITILNFISTIFNLFNGRLTHKTFVSTYKTDFISIESKIATQGIIQADGELVGKGSFSVEILKKSLKFIVPG